MTGLDQLVSIMKAPPELANYLPIRIVLKKEDGKYKGLIENSFSLDFSETHARIWWSGKAYSNLGTTHTLNGITSAEYHAKKGDIVVDPMSEDSPIIIEWDKWLLSESKFNKRNARFIVKEAE